MTSETVRPFSELRDSGMLWLINRAALHPRGFALAIHHDKDGNATGWQLIGDGSEPFGFDEPTDDDRFAAAEETLQQARKDKS